MPVILEITGFFIFLNYSAGEADTPEKDLSAGSLRPLRASAHSGP